MAKKAKTQLKSLKQPPLAGIPRLRNAKLDKYAEIVGECRDAINDATRRIKGFRAAALKEMLEKKTSFWSHGGVDFIVTPGEPALKIKTHKAGSSETGAAEEAGEEEPSIGTPADGAGEGEESPF